MTSRRPAASSGHLAIAILTATLGPVLVMGIAIAVGISAIGSAGSTVHEIAVGSQGSVFLTAGEYQVFDLDATTGSEMTVRAPGGATVPQTVVPPGELVTVGDRTYSVVADLTLPVNGYYEVRVARPGGVAGTGNMAIGPSAEQIARKLREPVTVGAVIAALLFLGGAVWTVLAIRERGRAKRLRELGDPPAAGDAGWPGSPPPAAPGTAG